MDFSGGLQFCFLSVPFWGSWRRGWVQVDAMKALAQFCHSKQAFLSRPQPYMALKLVSTLKPNDLIFLTPAKQLSLKEEEKLRIGYHQSGCQPPTPCPTTMPFSLRTVELFTHLPCSRSSKTWRTKIEDLFRSDLNIHSENSLNHNIIKSYREVMFFKNILQTPNPTRKYPKISQTIPQIRPVESSPTPTAAVARSSERVPTPPGSPSPQAPRWNRGFASGLREIGELGLVNQTVFALKRAV